MGGEAAGTDAPTAGRLSAEPAAGRSLESVMSAFPLEAAQQLLGEDVVAHLPQRVRLQLSLDGALQPEVVTAELHAWGGRLYFTGFVRKGAWCTLPLVCTGWRAVDAAGGAPQGGPPMPHIIFSVCHPPAAAPTAGTTRAVKPEAAALAAAMPPPPPRLPLHTTPPAPNAAAHGFRGSSAEGLLQRGVDQDHDRDLDQAADHDLEDDEADADGLLMLLTAGTDDHVHSVGAADHADHGLPDLAPTSAPKERDTLQQELQRQEQQLLQLHAQGAHKTAAASPLPPPATPQLQRGGTQAAAASPELHAAASFEAAHRALAGGLLGAPARTTAPSTPPASAFSPDSDELPARVKHECVASTLEMLSFSGASPPQVVAVEDRLLTMGMDKTALAAYYACPYQLIKCARERGDAAEVRRRLMAAFGVTVE